MTEVPATPTTAPAPDGRRRRISLSVFLAVVVVGAIVGAYLYVTRHGIETTDDAFLDGDVYSISAAVPGRIASVPVAEGDEVQAGQLLALVDPARYQARVDQMQAALAEAQAQEHQSALQVGIVDATTAAGVRQAQAEESAAEARVAEARADVDSARSESERRASELQRYRQLSERAVSPQRLQEVETTATAAGAQLQAAEKRLASAQAAGVAAAAARETAEAERQRVDASQREHEQRAAEVSVAEAQLAQARKDLADARIVAPAAGTVTRKAVLAGEYVQPGQALMAVVSPEVWVVANFKETQLGSMRSGQPAVVHVDAYDVDLEGHVELIQAGSGARFSLLPPQNATGNYVKVVQRVPVKIVLEGAPWQDHDLVPGLSVVPHVDTR